MKRVIVDRHGREKSMDDRYAKVLVAIGRARYVTRVMTADAEPPTAPVITPAEVAPTAVGPTIEAPAEPPREKRKYVRKTT